MQLRIRLSSGLLALFLALSALSGSRADSGSPPVPAWAPTDPTQTAPQRRGAVMAYDTANAEAVLFGGTSNGSLLLTATYLWNGTLWSAQTPNPSPPGRRGAVMAYDSGDHKTVLFGGDPGTTPFLSDTWLWDGTTWSESCGQAGSPCGSSGCGTAGQPVCLGARAGASMAYDAAHGKTVLFGGSAGPGGGLNDTWLWDGSSWSESAAIGPSARRGAEMAYDPIHQRVVLFGGTSPMGFLADTWSWDGSSWSPVCGAAPAPACGPSTCGGASQTACLTGRAGGAMAFDAATGTLVYFGGGGGAGLLQETWRLSGSNWEQQTTRGLPPARHSTSMVGDPVHGGTVLGGGSGAGVLADTWILREPQTGDVNVDGRRTSTDALCVLRQVALLAATTACPTVPAAPPTPADVNGDGVVDATDALCVLRAVAQLSATAACPLLGQP
jgi:hypothetical protein